MDTTLDTRLDTRPGKEPSTRPNIKSCTCLVMRLSTGRSRNTFSPTHQSGG